MNVERQQEFLFCSPFYKIHTLEFLKSATTVFDREVENIKKDSSFKINEIHPFIMTGNLFDETLNDFYSFINQEAWNILDGQGYDMINFQTFVGDSWGQVHFRYSSMDYHYHPESVISGFYIISAPEDSCKIIIHDPRMHKQFDQKLPVKPTNDISLASTSVLYSPKEGDMFFTNWWLPHSFTRNQSMSPFKFIHFNIYTQYVEACKPEII